MLYNIIGYKLTDIDDFKKYIAEGTFIIDKYDENDPTTLNKIKMTVRQTFKNVDGNDEAAYLTLIIDKSLFLSDIANHLGEIARLNKRIDLCNYIIATYPITA
jgi:hypothetical protein